MWGIFCRLYIELSSLLLPISNTESYGCSFATCLYKLLVNYVNLQKCPQLLVLDSQLAFYVLMLCRSPDSLTVQPKYANLPPHQPAKKSFVTSRVMTPERAPAEGSSRWQKQHASLCLDCRHTRGEEGGGGGRGEGRGKEREGEWQGGIGNRNRELENLSPSFSLFRKGPLKSKQNLSLDS